MTDNGTAQGEIIEGEIVESRGTAVAVRQQAAAVWVPDFAVTVDAMVAKVEAKNDFFRRVMRKGQHYGPLPGAAKPKEGEAEKQVLFKAGAELLLTSMGLFAELDDAAPPVVDYGEPDHEGRVCYRRRCRIYRQTGPGENERMKVAQAEGSCTSLEVKYRWRDSKRVCPQCGASTIIAGKKEWGGGWLCFKKQGGCGAKFNVNDMKISAQAVGRIPNPDLADTENTILKMADKRALVAATLIATGCSDIFTQDLEEDEELVTARTPPADPVPAPPPNRVLELEQKRGLRDLIARKWRDVPEADRHRVLQAWTKEQNGAGTSDIRTLDAAALAAFLAESDQLIAALRNPPPNGGKAPVGSVPAAQPMQAPDVRPAPPEGQEWPGRPPLELGPKVDLKTNARLFAILGELGIGTADTGSDAESRHQAKIERLRWAESYGVRVSSFSLLREPLARWLADRAAEELQALRANDATPIDVVGGDEACACCGEFPGELHAAGCLEAAPAT